MAAPAPASFADVETLAMGFLPASAAGDPTAATARVLQAERIRPERFTGQVEVTVHNLAGPLTGPLGLIAYFPSADATEAPHTYRAAHRGSAPGDLAQPVRFRMPLDAAEGLSFALTSGTAGQETLLPFRLSGRTEAGARPLGRGTYFIVAAERGASAPVDWSAYRVDLQATSAGLQLPALLEGEPTLVGAEVAHAVISIRQV